MNSPRNELSGSPESMSTAKNLLADIHHSACCEQENCPNGSKCDRYKNLWGHMKSCANPYCDYSMCNDSKKVFEHFQTCDNRSQCSLCECLQRQQGDSVFQLRMPEKKIECASPSKEREIKVHLQLLKHAEKCDGRCGAMNCSKMKELMQHYRECSAGHSPRHGQSPLLSPSASASATLLLGDECLLCRRLGNLYKMHRSVCKDKTCTVPVCEEKRRMQLLAGKFQELLLPK
jgi:hypothetical protein